MSVDVTQIDANVCVKGHVTAPRCKLGSKTCNIEIAHINDDEDEPLEMYVTLPIKYNTSTNISGYQRYAMRSIIEAIQELNRRTATFGCNLTMEVATDDLDTAENDIKMFYCDQEEDGLPAASKADVNKLRLRLIVINDDNGETKTISDNAGIYAVEDLLLGWDHLYTASPVFFACVKEAALEVEWFESFNYDAINFDALTYTATHKIPPPIDVTAQYRLCIVYGPDNELSSTSERTWSGEDIWYNWDSKVTTSDAFKKWITGKPCGCSGIKYLRPQGDDIDRENNIVNVPYVHPVPEIPDDTNLMDSLLFAVAICNGEGEVQLPMKLLHQMNGANVNASTYAFQLRMNLTPGAETDGVAVTKMFNDFEATDGPFQIYYDTSDIGDAYFFDNYEGVAIPTENVVIYVQIKFQAQGGECSDPDSMQTFNHVTYTDKTVPSYLNYCVSTDTLTIRFSTLAVLPKNRFNQDNTSPTLGEIQKAITDNGIDSSYNAILYCGLWTYP